MIDVLYNKLGSSKDVSLSAAAASAASAASVEWKDIDPAIFNRHSQASQQKVASKIIQKSEAKAAATTIQTVPSIPDTVTSVTPQTTAATAATPAIIFKNKKKATKDTSIKPLEVIMNETASFHNSSEYIKESLINFITKEEFSKIFGLTKCAEIMSGIVNNRWNKSTALFISFLLDKEVYYNDKAILYNKEKNRGRITTISSLC
jgi:hypothetical protein